MKRMHPVWRHYVDACCLGYMPVPLHGVTLYDTPRAWVRGGLITRSTSPYSNASCGLKYLLRLKSCWICAHPCRVSTGQLHLTEAARHLLASAHHTCVLEFETHREHTVS